MQMASYLVNQESNQDDQGYLRTRTRMVFAPSQDPRLTDKIEHLYHQSRFTILPHCPSPNARFRVVQIFPRFILSLPTSPRALRNANRDQGPLVKLTTDVSFLHPPYISRCSHSTHPEGARRKKIAISGTLKLQDAKRVQEEEHSPRRQV